MVRHKVRRVVWIVLCHKEELTDGCGTKGKHGHAELTQGLPLQYHAPQLYSIPEIWVSLKIRDPLKIHRFDTHPYLSEDGREE